MFYGEKYYCPYNEEGSNKNQGEYNDHIDIKGNPGIHKITKHIYCIKTGKMAGKGFRYRPAFNLIENGSTCLYKCKNKCRNNHCKNLSTVKLKAFVEP